MSWLLERLGVVCMTLASWSYAAANYFDALAIRLIVRAKPIPPPPRLPQIEIPSYVPRIAIERDRRSEPADTLPDTPRARPRNECRPVPLFMMSDTLGTRVHSDQWTRGRGTS